MKPVQLRTRNVPSKANAVVTSLSGRIAQGYMAQRLNTEREGFEPSIGDEPIHAFQATLICKLWRSLRSGIGVKSTRRRSVRSETRPKGAQKRTQDVSSAISARYTPSAQGFGAIYRVLRLAMANVGRPYDWESALTADQRLTVARWAC